MDLFINLFLITGTECELYATYVSQLEDQSKNVHMRCIELRLDLCKRTL